MLACVEAREEPLLGGGGNKSLRIEQIVILTLLSILVDAPVRAKEAHARHARDRLGKPLFLVLVRLVNSRMSLNVAMEVV